MYHKILRTVYSRIEEGGLLLGRLAPSRSFISQETTGYGNEGGARACMKNKMAEDLGGIPRPRTKEFSAVTRA